jgi:hypothetical protein
MNVIYGICACVATFAIASIAGSLSRLAEAWGKWLTSVAEGQDDPSGD